jgi:cytochrome c oxidase subunit 2
VSAMLPLFAQSFAGSAPRASTISGEVDALFFTLVGITALFTTGVAFALLYLAIRYRRRSPEELPPTTRVSLALEIAWTVVPLAIVIAVFVWGSKVYFHMNRPPDDAMTVTVVGKRWMWKLQQPTGQREINELHVPVGRAVKLVITSEDTIHSFYVPAFRIKRDAIPGRYVQAWFRATKPGVYHLLCAEYCGTDHSRMKGRIVVMEAHDYEAWLAAGAPPESPVAAGERLFADMGCAACHKPDSGDRGPSLAGIYREKVTLTTGETVPADDAYIRESIVNPAAKVVQGYQPVMPTFQGLLSEEQLLDLVAYVKSLPPPPAAPPSPGGEPTQPRAKGTKS